MNSKANGGLRSGKSAVKTVKGFTLIEMLIVIAIIGILSGISSLVIMGFVRDAQIESVNSKAQQAYASLQNLLVETEIKNNGKFFDEAYITTGKEAEDAAKAKLVSFEYYIEDGKLDITTLTLGEGWNTTSEVKYNSYATSGEAKTAMNFFKKYIEDTIDAGFTGQVYADIDIENFLVESVVYTETKGLAHEIVKGTDAYVDVFVKTGYKDKKVYGTKNVLVQKADYKMKGEYIGYYPFMSDVGYVLHKDNTPKNAT